MPNTVYIILSFTLRMMFQPQVVQIAYIYSGVNTCIPVSHVTNMWVFTNRLHLIFPPHSAVVYLSWQLFIRRAHTIQYGLGRRLNNVKSISSTAFYGLNTCSSFRVPTAANSQGKTAKCGLQAVSFLYKRNTTEGNYSSDIQMSLAAF